MFQKRILSWLFICSLIFSVQLHAKEESLRTLLSRSIEAGDLVKVQGLIDSRAVGINELSEGSDPISPLIEAACTAKISIMKYLVEKGACIEGASAKGYSPLVQFIVAGPRVSFQQLLETVRWLIDHGADVNGAGKDGYTPLMAACAHTRCLELVEMLLDRGAFIDARAKEEDTAYLFALRNNNVKAYRLLVSRGANTNITCKGYRPLSVLAWEGNIMMAKILIEEAGANVNACDVTGFTPLLCAVIGGQSAMVQFLVEKGANINAKTTTPIEIEIPPNNSYSMRKFVAFPKGSTALNFAKTMGWSAMINLITDLGGILYKEVEYKEITRW